MNENAECYFYSALDLGLPVEPDPVTDGFSITLGKAKYFFYGLIHGVNSYASVMIARDKLISNQLLEKAGIPVPKSRLVDTDDFFEGKLPDVIRELKYPLVIKPRSSQFGNDVVCNIKTYEQLYDEILKKLNVYSELVIQEFHGNLTSYRVLVANNKVIGIILRHPAHVIGDGEHNLKELIDLTNIQRKQLSDTFGPITVDTECQIRLDEIGINLDFVPKKNDRIELGYASNATRGGTYVSLKNKISKENKKIVIEAAKVLGLSIVGFDVQCQDIQLPFEKTGGVIIESNSNPSVRIHERPVEGESNRVTKTILKILIRKHPWSYLKALYHNPKTSLFVKIPLVLAILLISFAVFLVTKLF